MKKVHYGYPSTYIAKEKGKDKTENKDEIQRILNSFGSQCIERLRPYQRHGSSTPYLPVHCRGLECELLKQRRVAIFSR